MKHKQCYLFQEYLNSIQLCIILLLLSFYYYIKKKLFYLFYVLKLKKKKKQIMKTTYGCFEKGHGTHEKKKKQIVFKNKIETNVPNKKNLVGLTNSVL